MKRVRLVVGSLFSVAVLGCAADGSDPGGYVLLDRESRQAGVSIELGDHAVSSALPVSVSPEDRVVLHVGATEQPLKVSRGELLYVEGAAGHVTRLRLGKEVAPDQLRLTGEETAANDLAGQLGAAKVSPDAAGWRLRTPGVFTGAAFAHAPERLLGATPVLLNELEPAAGPVAAIAKAPAATVVAANESAAAEMAPGAVASRATVAFAPAATACPGVAGTWRGRVYSEWHGAYYDFVLTVGQSGSALKGTVIAEFWDAETDEVEPPGACAQAKQHVKVVEAASGTVDADGTMHLSSTSWHVASHMCGQRVTDYSPDKFVVPLADGATSAHAVASDDVVWVEGTPVELTRVSCR